MKESIKTIKSKVMEFINGPMVLFTRETLKMISSMEKGQSLIRMEK